jgi:phenylacetate-CoA ligase
LAVRFWQQELECIPRPQIAAFQDEKLKQSRLINRAYDSALYRSSWHKAGFAPSSIQNRADLRQVPYLTGSRLRDAFATYAIEDILTSQSVRFWYCTSGTTGSPKWIPYTDADLDVCEQTILRSMWLIGMDQSRLTWFNLVTPAPFISDGAAHFGIFAEMLGGLQNEHISSSPTEVTTSLPLASARKPNVLSAFPSVAARIAEAFPEAALAETRRRFQERKNLPNLAAMLLARFKGIRVRDVIKIRYGIFSGESLAPYRQTIIDHYGLEPYEVYACTEFLCFNVECPYHCGIHIWLDACIAEIIPQQELDKEENTAGYIPQALFLDEVPIGTMGEYVLTTFGEALPLVRYRTSDLLEVVGTERCRCGRTHPRVRVLRRLDDVVNMGLVRFSILEVEACLGQVSHSGKVINWQLRLERESYKPKPMLLIKAVRSGAEQALLDEIRSRLFEIEALRVGCENGLVANPDIKLVDRIEEVRTATDKVRRIVYGKTW